MLEAPHEDETFRRLCAMENARRLFRLLEKNPGFPDHLADFLEVMTSWRFTPQDIGLDGEECEKAIRFAQNLTSGSWKEGFMATA